MNNLPDMNLHKWTEIFFWELAATLFYFVGLSILVRCVDGMIEGLLALRKWIFDGLWGHMDAIALMKSRWLQKGIIGLLLAGWLIVVILVGIHIWST